MYTDKFCFSIVQRKNISREMPFLKEKNNKCMERRTLQDDYSSTRMYERFIFHCYSKINMKTKSVEVQYYEAFSLFNYIILNKLTYLNRIEGDVFMQCMDYVHYVAWYVYPTYTMQNVKTSLAFTYKTMKDTFIQ